MPRAGSVASEARSPLIVFRDGGGGRRLRLRALFDSARLPSSFVCRIVTYLSPDLVVTGGCRHCRGSVVEEGKPQSWPLSRPEFNLELVCLVLLCRFVQPPCVGATLSRIGDGSATTGNHETATGLELVGIKQQLDASHAQGIRTNTRTGCDSWVLSGLAALGLTVVCIWYPRLTALNTSHSSSSAV